MGAVAGHVLKQKLRGERRYPLVLMLEPLFRCNLSCAGCGKIQYPAHVLKRQLSPEACFRAAEECGAPIVSIPGGEPLLHPEIAAIVEGLVAQKKYVYLCTNALLLERRLGELRPSKRLVLSVHLDGLEPEHDASVCREGVYAVAVRAIREALARGFRVMTNTTLYTTADPDRVSTFLDEMARLGVEGMMLSPGYSYSKAPDRDHFLRRAKTQELFASILSGRSRRWKFNQSPLFLEFLTGARDYACTPWGMPTYSIFGWQKPCYLLQDGYAKTYRELMDGTDWSRYGRGRDERCSDCMVHCGYEASAVDDTFGSFRGFFAAARAAIFGPRVPGRPVRTGDGETAAAPESRAALAGSSSGREGEKR